MAVGLLFIGLLLFILIATETLRYWYVTRLQLPPRKSWLLTSLGCWHLCFPLIQLWLYCATCSLFAHLSPSEWEDLFITVPLTPAHAWHLISVQFNGFFSIMVKGILMNESYRLCTQGAYSFSGDMRQNNMRSNRLVAIINRDDRRQQSLVFLLHFLPILLSQKLGPIVKKKPRARNRPFYA